MSKDSRGAKTKVTIAEAIVEMARAVDGVAVALVQVARAVRKAGTR